MKHEPLCIEFPCTCVSILREKLEEAGVLMDTILDQSSRYLKENISLKNKIKDYMSCCCSGCGKVNNIAHKDRDYPEMGDVFKTGGFTLTITQSDLHKKEGRFVYSSKSPDSTDLVEV